MMETARLIFGKCSSTLSKINKENNPRLEKPNNIYDSIRGLAFLIVLLVHVLSHCIGFLDPYLQGVGKFGVWLFFVLSSFLLTTNYLLRNESKTKYIIGRIFRIVPLYYLAIILYSILGIITIKKADLPYILIGQFGPIHFWTIPVELYFYIFLLCVWFLRPKLRAPTFMAVTVAALVGLLVADKAPNSTNTLWYAPSFFCGYLLAIATSKSSKIAPATALSMCLLFLLLVLITPGSLYLLFKIAPSPYLMNMYFPISMLWGIFIFLIINTRSRTMLAIFTSSPMIFLGKISYSGYLFHWAVIELTIKYITNGILGASLSIALSIALAAVIRKMIEEPINKLRHPATNLVLRLHGKLLAQVKQDSHAP